MAIIFLQIQVDKTSNNASYLVCRIFDYETKTNLSNSMEGLYQLGFTISLTSFLFLKAFLIFKLQVCNFQNFAYWQDIIESFLLKCDIANFHVVLEIVDTWERICYVRTCIGHLFCKNRDILQNNKYQIKCKTQRIY